MERACEVGKSVVAYTIKFRTEEEEEEEEEAQLKVHFLP
jgi:hypothetical protein